FLPSFPTRRSSDLALYRGLKFTLVSPPGLEMPEHVLEQASRHGHVIEQTSQLEEGLSGADVIYATRVQKERFAAEELEGYRPQFQVNRNMIDAFCKDDVSI